MIFICYFYIFFLIFCSFQSSSIYCSFLCQCLTLPIYSYNISYLLHVREISRFQRHFFFIMIFTAFSSLTKKISAFPWAWLCFSTLHALLVSVIFDFLDFSHHRHLLLSLHLLHFCHSLHPWQPSHPFSMSSKNILYLLNHCLPSSYCWLGFLLLLLNS